MPPASQLTLQGRGPRRQRGIALVIVLWIVTLLSVMAGSFAYTARTETRLTTFGLERAQARALAEAAVAYAYNQVVIRADPEQPWPVQGTPRVWRYGPGEVSIAVIDSSGKLDLNHADRALLGGLIEANGIEEAEAEVLLDAIEDFRDPDDLIRVNGAEDDEYEEAGRPTGPKNAPFESVEELQQVLGITQDLYDALEANLTVVGHKGVNPAAATLEVLLAVPGIDPLVVEAYVAERDASIAEELPLPPVPPLGGYLSKAKGLAYHVSVKATLNTGTKTQLDATITQARRPGQVFHIVAWREG